MLKLMRARVVSADPLEIELEAAPGTAPGGGACPGDEAGGGSGREGEVRRAWSDPVLIGPCEVGDEVIVNTEALDLGLGSGGFDIVHVNLTRGLSGEGSREEHVMKLNYSPLQHAVETIERGVDAGATERPDGASAGTGGGPPPDRTESFAPVLAIGLHGHLAPAAWAVAETARQQGHEPPRIAYVQTGGGALPGSLSRDVTELGDRGLLAGHITAGPAYGGASEAITLVGAIDAAGAGDFDGVIAGPGPGILGSATAYGHGGMAALDVLHGALALGAPAVLCPRLSAADPRPRHRGLSHHTQAVLELLLDGVDLPLPEPAGDFNPEEAEDLVGRAGKGRHRITLEPVDLEGYARSGLPRRSMGRDLDEDPVFFAAPLAAGSRIAELIHR
ncbi:MAG: DUF3866 family protein [Thermoleophilia bacterium]|nr:DUF3866 family protein [Thermoleophilia bacterium]